MRCYFHPEQLLHHPRSYYSRGQMRTPQEVPEDWGDEVMSNIFVREPNAFRGELTWRSAFWSAQSAVAGARAVLDTDMHHGQGIQEIFYDRDDVVWRPSAGVVPWF